MNAKSRLAMRLLFLVSMFWLLSNIGFSQDTFVKKEFCKKSEVEILTNCGVPENYVIVGTSTFAKVSGLDSLSELSQSQIKKMRSFARRMKSCHILVDFSGELIPLTDGQGNPISARHSAFFALQPSYLCGSDD